MAKRLNRTRIRDTNFILGLCLLVTVLTRPVIGLETALHEALEMFGELLVAACVVGRIYCTAFLGGYKNQILITTGPFSMCRNPLYFCSFIGVVGISMMSNHLLLLLLIPALFVLVYYKLIRREEDSLQRLFGTEYTHYCAMTPRYWPRIGRFIAPDNLTVSSKLLTNAAMDGLLWFFALPIFELVEYAQRAGLIRTWSFLY